MQTKEELTLNDKIKFDAKGGAILGVLEGPVADFKHPTRNGRLYSKDLWEKVLKNPIVKEQFANGGIPGELDHPADREDICSEKIAVLMPEPPVLKDGEYWGKFHILNTPCGRIVYTLAKAGFRLGVSSRGTGDVDDYTNTVDPDSYDFTCFDVVLLPAVKEARMNLVTEGLKKEENIKKMLEENLTPLIDAEKEDKSKKIVAETINHLKESMDHMCVICGKEFHGWGNNAQPVANGLCCDDCNIEEVIPARLKELQKHESLKEEDKEELTVEDSEPITTNEEETSTSEDTHIDAAEEAVPTEKVSDIDGSSEECPPCNDVEEKSCIDDAKIIELLHAFLDKEGLELDGEGSEESDFITLFHEIVCPICINEPKESPEALDNTPVDDEKEEAENDGSSELIEQLQSLLKENSKLKEDLKTLQSEKAVSNTEVSKLTEQLNTFKSIAANAGKKALSLKSLETKNADLIKENTALKESLEKEKADATEFTNKVTLLTESVKSAEVKASSTEKDNKVLKEEFETFKQSTKQKLTEANERISKAKKLIEKYKGFAHDAADRYIERRALALGVNKNEIINKLNESYTLDDVDRVCEDLQVYSLNLSRLPFAFDKASGARAQIRENHQKDPLKSVDSEYDDNVDDYLLELAKLK